MPSGFASEDALSARLAREKAVRKAEKEKQLSEKEALFKSYDKEEVGVRGGIAASPTGEHFGVRGRRRKQMGMGSGTGAKHNTRTCRRTARERIGGNETPNRT